VGHQPSILIMEMDLTTQEMLSHLLEPEFVVHRACSKEEGIEKTKIVKPDLILLDLVTSRMDSIATLKKLRQADGNTSIIVLVACRSRNIAALALESGAIGYIEKPFEVQRVKEIVTEFIQKRKAIQELSIRQNIVGESPQIKEVWQLVGKYGPTDLPILLQGETGTGKELFARAIHEISNRSHEPFVVVDCYALPETLMESELFGYEKGAFTGADMKKPGRLEWANNGTLFLDEIGNLPVSYQPKLLRVIQEQQYTPLGGKKISSLNIRFISSSNIDLIDAIQKGNFREELYYRINGATIELPPLREREGDIELLALHFMERYKEKYNKPNLRISDKAMELLTSYQWPGNVRELNHVVSAGVIIADQLILPEHFIRNLYGRMGRSLNNGAPPASHDNDKIELNLRYTCDISKPIDLKRIGKEIIKDIENQIIAGVKRRYSLGQAELAKFLGIDQKTLWRIKSS